MGTPDFALAALKAIAEKTDHEIVCVYSQPPRPKGRGHQVQPSPVHDYADSKNIPVFTPKSLKNAEAQAEFAAHGLDVAIVAAYGLILPKAVLDAPKFGCLNIHASLLPRWRGASPIQRAIWAGDVETGITIMQMDEGLDTGPEILKRALSITPATTASTLHDQLAVLGGEMVVEVLDQLAATREPLPATPQNDAEFTYAPLLKKEDGNVHWTQSAAEIDRQIRALNPWPGVWTSVNGKRLKVLEAVLTDEKALDVMEAGKIISKRGNVVCGDGSLLRLIRVQPEGKAAMDFAAALNGKYLEVGAVLS
ncbi:MAG: methionyl-tRNA formyltransferase [Alphaproteobacteria bacterium]|nr:methionyl-tRNA formyltransferase [Alphaproteobacteria bacterium]MCD8526052.1 methionyl-tRNA formyltransferase [Alphaproteobacteria bacterium]MCD8571607.1 methionyl-tRNA formyltransferase [Alphaproteobacteria bacterium]